MPWTCRPQWEAGGDEHAHHPGDDRMLQSSAGAAVKKRESTRINNMENESARAEWGQG